MYRNDILEERMRSLGIKVADIAEATKLSRQTIYKIMAGDPSGRVVLCNLRDVADVLGLTLIDLFIDARLPGKAVKSRSVAV